MRVAITEARLIDVNPDDNHRYDLHGGDIVTVPDHLGQYWCDLGWAQDIASVHPTGPRIPGAHPHIQHLYRRHGRRHGSPPAHVVAQLERHDPADVPAEESEKDRATFEKARGENHARILKERALAPHDSNLGGN